MDGDGEPGSGPTDDAGETAGPEPASERGPLPPGLDVAAVRDALVEWYEADHRDLPWRGTTDPYEILVAEVMSQQTQLGRVADAWRAFCERWPTVEDLADADRADVVAFWSDRGLGYNNRARYLHESARQVVEGAVGPTDRPRGGGEAAGVDGEFPRTPDALQDLHGVGPYTANAVASFAFNNGEAVVDTNVKRVLYRAFGVPDEDSAFEDAAGELMPDGESRVWNNAIMELGGVACEKTPACDEAGCPWRGWCAAYASGDFTAPDVQSQPQFEGSRRQMRGRVVRALGEYGELSLDELGPRVRVDYTPEGEYGRAWLRGVLEDLEGDGLVAVEAEGDDTVARLRR